MARSTTTKRRPVMICATSSTEALSLPARLQAEGERAEHHRIQDRRDLRRDQEQDSSGYNLREIIDHIDELRFRSQREKHELSHLYEAKIKNMGNAGRNGGEYYTPRPLIRAMVQVVKPKIGERIYDGACGSAGFLCESFDYLKPKHRPDHARTSRHFRRAPSTARRRSPLPTSSPS